MPSFVRISLNVFIASAAAGVFNAAAFADSTPVTTAPAVPRKTSVPAGFESVKLDDRSFILQELDRAWVIEAVNTMNPTTRPATLPSDLSDALSSRRADLRDRIAKDLGLTDTATIETLFDQTLSPLLKKMDEFRPPLVYLVASNQQLRGTVKAGWDEPRFRYNRAADQIEYDDRINISLDKPMDDVVIPILFDEASSPTDRSKQVTEIISKTEGGIIRSIGDRSQLTTQGSLASFIGERAIAPLHLKNGQDWFAVGVTGVLSARYLEMLSGMRHEDLINVMTFEHPLNPVKSAPIDLLHPTRREDLRDEAVLPYADAFRRKSTRAIDAWLAEAEEGVLLKTLTAIKEKSPADGEALVALIQQTSGIDLAPRLRAK